MPEVQEQQLQPVKKKSNGCLYAVLIVGLLMVFFGVISLCTHTSTTTLEPLDGTVQKNVAQLVITPANTYAWHDVRVTVNGKFEAKIPVMEPNVAFTIGFARLSDEEGNILGLSRVVKTVEVDCTEGSNTWSFE